MNLGIDLGTCESCVGIYSQNVVQIIPNEEGNRSTPSVISFMDDDLLVGDAAKQNFTRNMQNSVQNIKNMALDATVTVSFKDEEKICTTQELLSLLIEKMKTVAEQYNGKQASAAVISMPSAFTEDQQQVLRDAAAKTGLEVLALLDDAVAAAIAYNFDTQLQDRLVLVLQIGAKKSEATVLVANKGTLAVVNKASCAVGGDNFDDRIVDFCKQEFKKKYKTSLDDNKKAILKLRQASDRSKIILSNSQSTAIECESLYDGMDFTLQLSRARFEGMNSDLFQACTVQLVQQLGNPQVTDVILAGGGCSIPKVQQLIQDLFPTQTIHKSITPEEVITHGCAIEAANLAENKNNGESKQVAVLSCAIGIQTETGIVPLFPKSTALPATQTLDVADASTLCLFQEQTKIVESTVQGKVSIFVSEQGQVKVTCG